jgi:arsenate reductase
VNWRKPRILFVCTGNACRSQMAEAICRHVAGNRFEALSCGSNPAGYVHPLALDTLERMGIDSSGLESKGWDRFLTEPIDAAITVCAEADLSCPVFPGGGVKVSWPMPDPSFLPAPDAERREFALRVAERLRLKVMHMANLDFDRLSNRELQEALEQLRDL